VRKARGGAPPPVPVAQGGGYLSRGADVEARKDDPVIAHSVRKMSSEARRFALLAAVFHAHLVAQVPASWTQVGTGGLSGIQGHAMAYDSQHGRTVLFGGFAATNNGGVFTGLFLSNTLGGAGGSWGVIAGTGPSPRSGAAMAHDSQRGRTVLFGGSGPGGTFGDTWELNGTIWTQVVTAGPSPRVSHAMAYDSQRGRTVLFGGTAGGTNTFADTWEWNGTSWTHWGVAGPAARSRHAMAYDSQRGRTVLFGGSLGSGTFSDTWEWNGIAWSGLAVTGPSARFGHALAYDSQRGRTVLFGGSGASIFADTWEWDGTGWTQRATAGPAARWQHALAYDSLRGRTVLFGGDDGSGLSNVNPHNDTWEWSGHYIGTAAVYGSGCGSPPLVLSPVANARPIINTTAQASLTNIPSSLAFVALGWSRTFFFGAPGAFTLPHPLAAFGMPGCDLLQSADATAQLVSFTGPGTATCSLVVPNATALTGRQVFLQGLAAAPGANAAGLIVSNGIEWVVGDS